MRSNESMLNWSADVPKSAGFYWYKNSHMIGPAIVRVGAYPDGPLLMSRTGFEGETPLIKGEWAGPIPEPSERR